MKNLFILTNQLGHPVPDIKGFESKMEAKQVRDKLNYDKFGAADYNEAAKKHKGSIPNGFVKVVPGPDHLLYREDQS